MKLAMTGATYGAAATQSISPSVFVKVRDVFLGVSSFPHFLSFRLDFLSFDYDLNVDTVVFSLLIYIFFYFSNEVQCINESSESKSFVRKNSIVFLLCDVSEHLLN